MTRRWRMAAFVGIGGVTLAGCASWRTAHGRRGEAYPKEYAGVPVEGPMLAEGVPVTHYPEGAFVPMPGSVPPGVAVIPPGAIIGTPGTMPPPAATPPASPPPVGPPPRPAPGTPGTTTRQRS